MQSRSWSTHMFGMGTDRKLESMLFQLMQWALVHRDAGRDASTPADFPVYVRISEPS